MRSSRSTLVLAPAEFSRALDRLERDVSAGMTVSDAYLAIARVMSRIACGHTFPNPANQSGAVADAVFRRTPRVPFFFRWMGRAMVVTRDASASRAFPVGTEVLSINGVAAAAIRDSLVPYSRADGSNDAKRVANHALYPAERWQAFDVYFPLLFPAATDVWTFRVRLPNGATRVVAVPPATAAQRTALYDSLARARAGTTSPPWTLDLADARTAVLTMPTWVTFNDNWDWKAYVTRAFDELVRRGTPNLVIDLRGNEGGSDVGDELLAHLVDTVTLVSNVKRFTRYQQVPARLRPYLDTWDRSFDDWGAAATPSTSRPGLYALARSASDTAGVAITPSAPRYTGRVFVLVGADNSSATFQFAQAIRERRLGTLVGQPTGGNQRGINGGGFYFLRLPNSRIEVDVPLIAFFPAGVKPDGGIAPDIGVPVRASDVAARRDPEREAVERLVSRPGRRVSPARAAARP